MAISPEQKKHGIVLLLSLAATIALCWLMLVMFDLPTTTLDTALPAEQVVTGNEPIITLVDGRTFNGMGKFKIGDEEIEIQRVTAEGIGISKGATLLENPNRFKVLKRGVNGTTIEAHSKGAEVSYTDGTTFFFPENNASFGDAVDELFYLILWITGIAFIVTEAFFIFCVICFWDGPGKKADYVTGHHTFEMVATLGVVTVLVLLGLWQSAMWTQMKQVMPVSMAGKADFETQERMADAADTPQKKPPVHIQIVGTRFKWYFRHPGLDGRFATEDDISSARMVVPVGRDVLMHMRSQDVIHSFFLPNYRVKQDVVPGMAIPGWFRPLRTGNHQIMCAELCGEGHTTMGTLLEVKTIEEYRTWVRSKSAEFAELHDGELRRDWFGPEAKFWWWWDSNETRVGYAEDYLK